MATAAYEQHAFSGRPVLLYEFFRVSNGTTYSWYYTNGDRNVFYNGVEWKKTNISDDGVRLSAEAASTDLVVTMPITEPFCDQFRLNGTTPSDTVWLRVRRVHVGDIDGIDGDTPTVLADALLVWQGTVNGINQTDNLTAKVRCSMVSASLRRSGLRYGYQKNCPHILYMSNTCRMNKADFLIPATVTAIDGLTISAAEFDAQDDGWFNGGFIEYILPSGMMERRMIVSHVGADITITGLPVGMAVDDVISAYPGCDRTIDTCVAKFNNLANFGGFPHSPGRNPFDGNPVF